MSVASSFPKTDRLYVSNSESTIDNIYKITNYSNTEDMTMDGGVIKDNNTVSKTQDLMAL